MGKSAQVLNQDATMEIFQKRLLDAMEPLSRLWKGLEDIKNTPDDVVPVPVEDHINFIRQKFFLLNQASDSIFYSQRL